MADWQNLFTGTVVLLIMASDTFYFLNPVYCKKRATSSRNSSWKCHIYKVIQSLRVYPKILTSENIQTIFANCLDIEFVF